MNLIRNIFGKERKLSKATDIPVTTDIHSHLVPGIDDGSESMEESISLIKALQQMGYKKIITTPHIMGDFYKNTSTIIREGYAALKEEISKQQIDIELEVACEYYIDDHFMNLIEKDDILSFGKRYVLVESNTINYTEIVRKAFFNLGIAGYQPVFAHPERYYYLWKDFNRYHEFHDMGIYFQLNIVSLAGYYSSTVKGIAEKLIDARLVDFIGSDLHEMRYADAMMAARFSPYMNKLKDLNLLNNTL